MTSSFAEGGSVIATLFLILAAGAPALQKFIVEHPESRRIESADGLRFVHASGFLATTGAAEPEAAARAFLAVHGEAFGVAGNQALVLRGE